MTTFDYTILGGTICGIMMVLGGFILLYKGAIKLEGASKDPALTLEVFEKQFKLTTHAPALGLFVIGLLFIGVGIYSARETTVSPIELKAETKGETGIIDEPVTVRVTSEWGVPAVHGSVRYVLRPALDVLWIYFKAPGYETYAQSFSKESIKKSVDLGEIKLKKRLPRIEPNKKNIPDYPPGVEPTPLTQSGSFGGGELR